MLRRSAVLASFVVAAAFALPFGGCSNQGEGERCNRLSENSGNADCKDGLVCKAAQGTLGGTENLGYCCPENDQNATVSVCRQQQGGTGPASDNGIPDTGTDAVTPNDGAVQGDASDASDGATEASLDGATGSDANTGDAAGDAPVDAVGDAAEGG